VLMQLQALRPRRRVCRTVPTNLLDLPLVAEQPNCRAPESEMDRRHRR
jgi:hypothetical protein